jgi:predicted transcriptional regulator
MATMNTSSISDLQIDSALLSAAKSVLQEGETLQGFVEQSIRQSVRIRQMQGDFIARGLARAEEAERTGDYFDADEVLRELDGMLVAKERDGGR